MKGNGLSNLQFVTICIIIMFCGLAVLFRDSIEDGKDMAYDSIALMYQKAEQEKQEAENKNTQNNSKLDDEKENIDNNSEESEEYDGSDTPSNGSVSGDYNAIGDTSRNVSNTNKKKYVYAGWIKIPKMGLYKGFLANKKNNVFCVDHDVCAYSWVGNSPKMANSKLVIGAHNGSRNNAYFRGLEVLKKKDKVYIEYKGISYKYEVISKYKRPKSNHAITVYNTPGKELYLFTCAKEQHYAKNYLIYRLKLVSEDDM